MLASHSSPATLSEEELLLAGVRWNFLRRPVEARRAASSARAAWMRAAPCLNSNWVVPPYKPRTGRPPQHLDRPLSDHLLAPTAHYLRGRAMIALDELEGATLEADLLDKDARRKRPPPDSQVFLADLRKRLRAPEAPPPLVENVMLQPVDELKQAAAELRDLDSSSPPPPGGLDEFLKRVGTTVEQTIRGLSNTVGFGGYSPDSIGPRRQAAHIPLGGVQLRFRRPQGNRRIWNWMTCGQTNRGRP